MTHRQVLELAGRLCVYGADAVQKCRGIPVAALRRYGQANETRSQAWCRILLGAGGWTHTPSGNAGNKSILPVLQELATTSVLVRVASTILDSIGRRLDIPLAIDVASRTADVHSRARFAAIAAVTRRTDFPPDDLDSLNRLGRLCDRLNDVLCGALMPSLKTDRFAVDPERAADFADTFGGRPALVQVPLRLALKLAPTSTLVLSQMAEQVEQAILACLPHLAGIHPNPAVSRPEQQSIPSKHNLRIPSAEPETLSQPSLEREKTLLFPAFSFAAALRRMGR